MNSCYDLFGTADLATGRLARRAIIRALRTKHRRLSENDDLFRASRDESLRALSRLVAAKAPDVLLATIHAARFPSEAEKQRCQMTTSVSLSQVLRWAEKEVLEHAKSVPGLAFQLLTASRQRLHLTAMVLAVSDGPVDAALLQDALTLPIREVLAALGLSGIKGLRRSLGRIRGRVLDREHYRQLISLLCESTTAEVLHHVSEVTPELIDNLSGLTRLTI